MRTREVNISNYAEVYGKPKTAKAMGITRQRVQQMVSEGAPVFLRLEAATGAVIGWYIYRDVEQA